MKMNIRKNKGITLITLIVTIIILLILAGITITAIFGENGMINKSITAEEKTNIAKAREKLELVLNTDVALEKRTNPKYNQDDFLDELILLRIEDAEILKEENIVIVDNQAFELDREVPKIGEYIGRADKLPPKIEKIQLTSNTSSITAQVETKRAEGANYYYYYKTEEDEKYTLTHKGSETTYTIEPLKQDTTYTIKIEVQNKNGKDDGVAVARTGEIPTAVGAITFTNGTWENGKHSVTITKTTNDNYKIEYQVINEEGEITVDYTKIDGGGIIGNLNYKDVVIAKLTDGTNSGKTATYNVGDGIAPTITINRGTIKSGSIQVNIEATDEQSGMTSTPTYKYYIKQSSGTYPTTAVESNSTSHTFTGLSKSTSYDVKIEVEDKAGNKGMQELKGISTAGIATMQYSPNGNTTYKKSQSTTVTVSEATEKVNSIKYQWLQTTNTPSETSFTTTCSNRETVTKSTGTGTWYLWTLVETETGTTDITRSNAFYLDNKGPTVTLTSKAVSTSSFTLTATASDSHIGTIATYKFYVNGTLKSTQTTSSRTASYTVTGATMGETNCYVIVTDSLGNPTTKTTTAATKLYTWEMWEISDDVAYEKEVLGSSSGSIPSTAAMNFYYIMGGEPQLDTSTGKFNVGYNDGVCQPYDIKRGMCFIPKGGYPNGTQYCIVTSTSGGSTSSYIYYYNMIGSKQVPKKGNSNLGTATSTSRNTYPDDGVSRRLLVCIQRINIIKLKEEKFNIFPLCQFN